MPPDLFSPTGVETELEQEWRQPTHGPTAWVEYLVFATTVGHRDHTCDPSDHHNRQLYDNCHVTT